MVGTDLAVLGTNFECGRKVHRDLFVDRVVGLVRELEVMEVMEVVGQVACVFEDCGCFLIWPDCFIFGGFSVIGSGKIEPEKIT